VIGNKFINSESRVVSYQDHTDQHETVGAAVGSSSQKPGGV
jgi:hypothetical protein